MGLADSKTKYLTKVVVFGGQKMTLFSLDGNTWSTRKLELADVKARQEQQRAELAGKKDEAEGAVVAPAKPARDDDDEMEADLDPAYGLDPLSKTVAGEEEEELPFAVAEEDEEPASKKTKGKNFVRPKTTKAIGKLPLKPAAVVFEKDKKKSQVKMVVKSKPAKKEKLVKSKKSAKVTSIKKNSKKTKSVTSKGRKAA